MKIVLATPLYPPDVAWPAPYVKELARRLAPLHEITIATYGNLPEKVEGVRIVTTSKRRPLPWRLFLFILTLWRAARGADLIYAENGASVELPLLVTSLLLHTPVVMHLGDVRAHAHAQQGGVRQWLERALLKRVKKIVPGSPAPRPEILPLEEYPTNALAEYDASWHQHLKELEDVFIYAKQ